MDFPTFEQVLDAQNISIQLQLDHWLKFEVFSPQFWLLIGMLIIPWFIWFKLVERKRLLEIIIFGLIISIIVTTLDELGCQLNLWEYLYDIEPLFPRLIPMNFTLLPIGYMLVYQYFTKWKSFVAANAVVAAFYSFIGEPFLKMAGIYAMLNWKQIYSFPIYIIIAVLVRVLVDWIVSKKEASPA